MGGNNGAQAQRPLQAQADSKKPTGDNYPKLEYDARELPLNRTSALADASRSTPGVTASGRAHPESMG